MIKRIYLDNNATTCVDERVIAAILTELNEGLGNPSSIHSFGRAAKAKLILARQTIANYLNVKPQEIIFTSGGTEGANLLIRGLFSPQENAHIITSGCEHAAVYETLKYLQSSQLKVSFLQTGAFGAVTARQVLEALQPNTKAIILMAVNNETGVKTDVDGIAKLAKENNIPFIVDGVAWLGKEIGGIKDGITGMFFSGHKIHAPKGVGFAYVNQRLKLRATMTGGEQEFQRRAGTENLPAIIGLAKAVELLAEELPKSATRMLYLREKFENTLLAHVPNCALNGLGPRTVNTSNVAFLGLEGELLLAKLDLAGVCASHGSACASGGLQPSRILLNMGVPMDVAAASIRFSLSRKTTEEEIDQALEIIIKCVKGEK